MGGSVSIIIPVYNEKKIIEENSKSIIRYMNSIGVEYEILFVDNGSTDDTLKIARNISKSNKRVKVFSIPQKSLGDALRLGFRKASGEVLVWYPIDMSVDLGYIKKSVDGIGGYDIILGSKEHPETVIYRPFSRTLMTKVYNFIVNLLFGLSISDTQCVKTIKKESITKLLDKTKSGGIVFEVELLYHARKNNLRIIEYPIIARDIRVDTKIRLLDKIKAIVDLIKLRIKLFSV